VNWKLIVSLVLLFFVAGSVIHQQRRIASLERDVSLLRVSMQNMEVKAPSRRSLFFEQYSPGDLRTRQSQTKTQNLSRLRSAPILPRRNSANKVETAQEMLAAALSGDTTALDRLDQFASGAASEATSSTEGEAVLNQLRAAFSVMSEEAGNGNSDALGILWRATRKSYLAGLATDAIGHAAALGNDLALELLLSPEQYGILLSSAVGALIEVAEAGNELAIEALAAVTQDESKSALWYLAASGLQRAAESGNELAMESLATLLQANDANIRELARQTLERASLNGYITARNALAQAPTQ
jgi:hypothetical protein